MVGKDHRCDHEVRRTMDSDEGRAIDRAYLCVSLARDLLEAVILAVANIRRLLTR